MTQERLKEVLSYDPGTGVFVWLKTTSNRVSVGDYAGWISDSGYLITNVDGEKHRCHRLAFLYMEGYFPEHAVDHINGIRDDNRWCNLRHVTKSCNMQNAAIPKNNTSGYMGVDFRKSRGKWRSRITVNGRIYSLGLYHTALDAALARIAAEDCMPDWHCDERCENRKKVFADLIAGG